MAERRALATDNIYDIVGIGFGPSNLALAIALRERNEEAQGRRTLRSVFFEQQAEFGWHPGMLIKGATMQVSFLKDLVTLRDPTSPFSFLSYLRERNRLADFINHQTFFPSRVEFHDYLSWAASHFEDRVRYQSKVTELRPVLAGADVVALDVVVVRAGESVVTRARNVVIAQGLAPVVPDGVDLSETVWHSSELLHRLAGLRGEPPRGFIVAGAGQSAAEVILLLHDSFPHAEIISVSPRYGFIPADDTPFVNRIFDPAAVDAFFHSSARSKEVLMAYHRNTNYSAVDTDLIGELYRRSYQESVLGKRRLSVISMSRVVASRPTATGVSVDVQAIGGDQITRLDSDILIYATGYKPADPLGMFSELRLLCKTDALGRLRISRDYRIVTGENVRCGLYLQGGTEHTHGLSSTLLSNVAIRTAEIVQSLERAYDAADHGK